MRIRIGSPFLLTIISIFSILFFATSIAAQQASDMPPIGSSSGMPPVGGQSPAQNALALAQAAKLAADQQVSTAQGTLESAQSAVQTAQQTLTTAQDTLVSATSALQEAESAVEAETQQKAELIRVAEEAVQQAEQNLQTAEKELDAARMALREVKPFSLLPINPKSFASDFEEEYNSIDVLANSQRSRNALKRFIDDIDATNQELQRTIIPLRKERDKLDNNVGKIVERLRLTSIINERQNVQSFVNLIFIALEGGSAGGGSFRTPSHESILDLIREFTRRSKINGPGNPFETIYFENSQR